MPVPSPREVRLLLFVDRKGRPRMRVSVNDMPAVHTDVYAGAQGVALAAAAFDGRVVEALGCPTLPQQTYELGHDIGYRDALDQALMVLKRVWQGSSTIEEVEASLQQARAAVQRSLDARCSGDEAEPLNDEKGGTP